MNKLLFNNNIDYYNPIPNTKINIIVSDGNYQYHKIIKYKERKIFKVYKDKKTKRLLRDKEDNIIKDIKKDIANIKKDIKDIKNGITGLMKKTKENNKVKVA